VTWPKRVPTLSPELLDKQRQWHRFWLEHYPSRFSFVSRFTEDFLRAAGRVRSPERILEIGPGPTSAIREIMAPADAYSCCEQDPHFCEALRKKLPDAQVICADIQVRLPIDDHSFDRIVAAHLLEHLPNLPAALEEVTRLLHPGGAFDVVIPCEGSPLYTLGRLFSSARTFRKHFGSGFFEMMRVEHVNTAREIISELRTRFVVEFERYYPVPSRRFGASLNLLAGVRLRNRQQSGIPGRG